MSRLYCCNSTDLPVNIPYACIVEEKNILLIRTNTGVFALENRCPHQARPLEEGTVEGNSIRCFYHSVQICLKSGKVLDDNHYKGLQDLTTYSVQEKDNQIWIEL